MAQLGGSPGTRREVPETLAAAAGESYLRQMFHEFADLVQLVQVLNPSSAAGTPSVTLPTFLPDIQKVVPVLSRKEYPTLPSCTRLELRCASAKTKQTRVQSCPPEKYRSWPRQAPWRKQR